MTKDKQRIKAVRIRDGKFCLDGKILSPERIQMDCISLSVGPHPDADVTGYTEESPPLRTLIIHYKP